MSVSQARQRLAQDGPNDIAESDTRSSLRVIRAVALEPMFLLLMAGGAIYMALGDAQEALMLLGFVFFVMAITFIQESRTDRSLRALRKLSNPQALVLRDGVTRTIDARELVAGDIALLAEGDRVPGDMRLVASSNLAVDESLLTGGVRGRGQVGRGAGR